MKKENNLMKVTALTSGAAILTVFGTSTNAANLLQYESLGSGSQLRTNLITVDAMQAFSSNTDVEFECGEGKCGEGNCGDHQKKADNTVMKSTTTTVKATTVSESQEMKSDTKTKEGDNNKKNRDDKKENKDRPKS